MKLEQINAIWAVIIVPVFIVLSLLFWARLEEWERDYREVYPDSAFRVIEKKEIL